MPDYSKAVIYKIETGGQLYVGSTCNFTRRKYKHNIRINFKDTERSCTTKLYNTIRQNGEWNMTPIKEFPCENKTQLTIEEEKCRKELGATLNTNQCYITDAEVYEKRLEISKKYREHNKEKMRDYHKQYQEQNKEKIRERANQKIECPICGSVVTRKGMKQHQRKAKCKSIALQETQP